MPLTSIICESCGQDHEARRSDAKYCGSCRLLKTLTWTRLNVKGTRGCSDCGQRFRAIHVRDQYLCGECEAGYRSPTDPKVDCAFCGQTEHPALRWSTVRCCLVCVKSAAKRPGGKLLRTYIIEGLQEGLANRKS